MDFQPKIFHASSKVEEKPMLLLSNRTLDFGAGFYATPDKSHAEAFCQRFLRQNRQAVCNVYRVDMQEVDEDCEVCYFEIPDRKWVEFVATNRTGAFLTDYSKYDVIIGPAGDNILYSLISLLETGVIDVDEAVRRCQNHAYTDQIVFKTQKALSYIRYIHSYSL